MFQHHVLSCTVHNHAELFAPMSLGLTWLGTTRLPGVTQWKVKPFNMHKLMIPLHWLTQQILHLMPSTKISRANNAECPLAPHLNSYLFSEPRSVLVVFSLAPLPFSPSSLSPFLPSLSCSESLKVHKIQQTMLLAARHHCTAVLHRYLSKYKQI